MLATKIDENFSPVIISTYNLYPFLEYLLTLDESLLEGLLQVLDVLVLRLVLLVLLVQHVVLDVGLFHLFPQSVTFNFYYLIPENNNGFIITWMLQQTIMYSNKVKIVAG